MQTNPLSAQEAEAKVKRVWPDAHAFCVASGWYILPNREAHLGMAMGMGNSKEAAWLNASEFGVPDGARGESEPQPNIKPQCGSCAGPLPYHLPGCFYLLAEEEKQRRIELQQPDYRTLYEHERALADDLSFWLNGLLVTHRSLLKLAKVNSPELGESYSQSKAVEALASYKAIRTPKDTQQ